MLFEGVSQDSFICVIGKPFVQNKTKPNMILEYDNKKIKKKEREMKLVGERENLR